MDNQLQLFQNEEFGRLEILMIGDKPYFPAFSCAKIFGYSRPNDAVSRHCRCTVKHSIPHPQSPNKTIEVNFIPEGDLYRLLIRSKLPGAERFEQWVFDEVLPSIRRHGAYATDETLAKIMESPVFAQRLFKALAQERRKTTELESYVAELAPKARYYDRILQSKAAVQVSIIAKDYGMSAVLFNRLLHDLGVQYKMGGTWLLYQKYADQGYTVSRTYRIGENKSVMHTYWTQRGRVFLYYLLKQYGIIPMMEDGDAALFPDYE